VAKLIYSALMSLDGYIADRDGNFDWAEPDEEVHAFINDLERSVGTYLLGRRTYEILRVWETLELEGEPDVMRDFAGIWRAADKVVYSTTLSSVDTARTTIERRFDPDAVRELRDAAELDLGIGGPELAAHAFRAGLVEECHLFLAPVVIGGGTRAIPDDVRVELELRDQRSFDSGMVFLHHLVRR